MYVVLLSEIRTPPKVYDVCVSVRLLRLFVLIAQRKKETEGKSRDV